MALEYMFGQEEGNMLGFMQMMKNKDTENIIGMMVEFSKAGGHTTNSMGQENTESLMVL